MASNGETPKDSQRTAQFDSTTESEAKPTKIRKLNELSVEQPHESNQEIEKPKEENKKLQHQNNNLDHNRNLYDDHNQVHTIVRIQSK